MFKHNWLFSTQLVVCFALAVFLSSDAATKPKTARAVIPFDVWIQGAKLPAGAYEISHISSPTVLVFTSSDHKRSTQVFMLPVNTDPVKTDESKLVFFVNGEQHYFYEIWCVYGRRIVSAQYGAPEPTGDNRVEVPIVYQ